MHAAKVEKSTRLRKCLMFLRAAGRPGATTAELQGFTASMAPATDVSELRAQGYEIDCTYQGTSRRGRKVYRYTYKGKKEN
jgi:hypothetical protein